MVLASAYSPLLLTHWDSPYGQASSQHVLVLWPRVVALGLVWVVCWASLWSAWAWHGGWLRRRREVEEAMLALTV